MLFSELHLDLAHRYLCFVWHPPQTQRHFMVELFSSFLYLLMKALKGQKQVVLLGKIILQKYEAYAWRNDLAKRLFPIFSWEIPSVFSFFNFYATIDNKPGPVLGKIIKYSTKWKTKKKTLLFHETISSNINLFLEDWIGIQYLGTYLMRIPSSWASRKKFIIELSRGQRELY